MLLNGNSPKGYDSLRQHDILSLPSVETLHSYSGISLMENGSSEAMRQRMKTCLEDLTPLQRHVSMQIDEMQIQECLVYNKSQDKMIGLGENSKQEEEPVLANKML